MRDVFYLAFFLNYVVPTKRDGQPGRKAQTQLPNGIWQKTKGMMANMQEMHAVFPDFLKRITSSVDHTH